MKSLVIVFTFAMITTVSAQSLLLPPSYNMPPKTYPLSRNKEPIGTATLLGNKLYLRNMKEEHFATVVFNKDGTKTIYDQSGKVIEKALDNIDLPGGTDAN